MGDAAEVVMYLLAPAGELASWWTLYGTLLRTRAPVEDIAVETLVALTV